MILPSSRFQIIGLIFLMSLYIPWRAWQKKNMSGFLAIAWAYSLLLCIWFGFPLAATVEMNPIFARLEQNALVTWAVGFSLLVLFTEFSRIFPRNGKFFTWFFVLFFTLDITFILFFKSRGFLDANNFDLSLGLCFLPWCFLPRSLCQIGRRELLARRCIGVYMLLACYLIPGSTPRAVVITVLGAWFLTTRKYISLCVLAVVCALVFFYYKDLDFHNTGGRLSMWKEFLKIQRDSGAHSFWIGLGPGSFDWIGFVHANCRGVFKFVGFNIAPECVRTVLLHNDWIQCLIEYGFIGLVFMVVIYLRTLLKFAWTEYRVMFCASCGFGVIMITYYPLHFALSQVMALWLIFVADSLEIDRSKI